MDRVFIYWDVIDFFDDMHRLAAERDTAPGARYLARVNFDAVIELARADRLLEKAVVAGPAFPMLQKAFDRLGEGGAKTRVFNLDALDEVEYEEPEHYLEMCMLKDGLDYHDDPGTIVLITGAGASYMNHDGLHETLERLHGRGWRIEVLSWANICDTGVRKWAEENGVFVALDDFYASVTYLESSHPAHDPAPARESTPLDLSRRPGCGAPGLATKPAAGVQPAAARG